MKCRLVVNVMSVVFAIAALTSACGGRVPEEGGASIMASDSQAMGDVGLLAFDIGNAMGSPVRTGNTCGASNEWTPPCVTSSTAADNTFWWRAPYSGTFNINTSVPWYVSSYDTVLHVYDATTGALLGCNDDASGLQSSVTVNLVGNQQVRIVVDGYSNSCGNFYLNIKCSGPNCPAWTPWTSEEFPPISCNGNNLVSKAACRNSNCDDVQFYCDANNGARTSWSYWTPQFSDENYPYGQTCAWGYWVTGLSCADSYCDRVSLQCTQMNNITPAGCYWTSFFSEETGVQSFPAGYFAVGAMCRNNYCDDMSYYVCQAK